MIQNKQRRFSTVSERLYNSSLDATTDTLAGVQFILMEHSFIPSKNGKGNAARD